MLWTSPLISNFASPFGVTPVKKPVSFFDEVINVVQFCWSNQVDKLIPSKHINVESTMKQSLLSTFIKVVSTLIFD